MSLVSETVTRVWRCDSCGKVDQWNDNWLSKLIMHKSNGGWDEEITVCSTECAIRFDGKRKRKRRTNNET